jgi:hypothetical protein
LISTPKVQSCALDRLDTVSPRKHSSPSRDQTFSQKMFGTHRLERSRPNIAPNPPLERRNRQLTLNLTLTLVLMRMLTLTPSLGRLTSARDTAVHASPRSRTSRAFLFAGGTGRNARRLTKTQPTCSSAYVPSPPSAAPRKLQPGRDLGAARRKL